MADEIGPLIDLLVQRDSCWEEIIERSLGVPMRWAPLAVANLDRELWIGVAMSGRWVLGVPDAFASQRVVGGLCFSGCVYSFVPLLPILDRTAGAVARDLVSYAERYELPGDVLWSCVPWRLAVLTALRSGQPHETGFNLSCPEKGRTGRTSEVLKNEDRH
jgi:hypothetical protein